jgi:hypothetical protein
MHGHFYQPPREDPWLEMLIAQPSAAPYHDWNERVERECYRAVVAARVPGAQGRIQRIENLLTHLSFDFGPTLLEWLERQAVSTYEAILEADRRSQDLHRGHGNAIAQAYHHTILPLASRREKTTEVRWGIADFRRRFRREPVGMWLPETAVDGETLEVLAGEGIAFTIVAPHQIKPLPKGGLPGLFRASGGRTLALFVYDAPLSHAVAFGSLLQDAERWANAVLDSGDPPDGEVGAGVQPARLLAIATDGETFGHHHRFGEMALASVLTRLMDTPCVRVENFSSFLRRNPPLQEVKVVEPSSWSCPHGVERWRTDCGCRMDPLRPTQQLWRSHLREAMEELASGLHDIYLEEAPSLLGDPWDARNGYGNVVVLGPEAIAEYVRSRASRPLAAGEAVRAAELLEMERNALRVFTSCGWFFDDLAGIEPLQILRYAARAMELAGSRGSTLEDRLLRRLERARTNETPPRDGRILFVEEVKPPFPTPFAVAAGAAAVQGVAGDRPLPPIDPGTPAVPGYRIAREEPGEMRVIHRRTGREWDVEFEVGQGEPGFLQVRVWPKGRPEEALVLQTADLPEVFRLPVRGELRDTILGAWAPDLLAAARAADAGGLARMLERELLAALVALESEVWDGESPLDADDSLGRVADLARIHTLLDLPISFDAQTVFYRLLQSSAPSREARLRALREPLGFVPS